jgi:hypothetical protein
MTNTQPEGMMQDVTYAFENYVKTCIRYFKIIDESDIIQQDYNGSPSKPPSLPTCLEESSNESEHSDNDDLDDESEDADEPEEYNEDEPEEDDEDEEEEDEDEDDEEDEEVSEHYAGKKEEPFEITTAHKSRFINEDALCAIISEDEDESEEVEQPKIELKEEKKRPSKKENTVAPVAIKGTLDMFMRGSKQEPPQRTRSAKDIVPKVKDINLENPELKNKGIGKNNW